MDPLLRLLEENALATHETLAAQLDTTPAEIKKRIKQLEHDRVILAYKAIVDDERAKRTQVKAVIEVRITPEREAASTAWPTASPVPRSPILLSHERRLRPARLHRGQHAPGGRRLRVRETLHPARRPLHGHHFNLKTYKIQGVLREAVVNEERLKVSP